jgi:protease I
MNKPMVGTKVAILVANGFDQKQMTAVQRAMVAQGASVKIISTDNGLVNGWDGEGWGHNFAVDAPLNTALGVDYACLVVVGGQRSLDKLKLTAHTKRFIGSFMSAQKPVAIMGDAPMLMAHVEHASGRHMTGTETSKMMATKAGALWSDDAICFDGNIMSCACAAEHMEEFIKTMVSHFQQNAQIPQAA